uniref:Uncharacterized protein n=1 Tax=Ditylenchus dipsaci TaxID=166011 RepID=A0A915E595_9BILA
MNHMWVIEKIRRKYVATSVCNELFQLYHNFHLHLHDFFVPSQLVITFAQFCWFHIHGFPPVIYLGPIKKFKPHKVHASSKTASSAGGRTSNSVL